MSTKVSNKQDTKTALLQVGMQVMMEKGYTNTGIQEVLAALSIPKGSFYHHFDSKETFAVEIIHYFDHDYSANISRILRNPKQTPLERLRTYCNENKAMLAAQECRKGCLIGNLSQEMADQSEVLRKELSLVMNKWRDMFAACIEEGQAAGEITKKHSAQELAEVVSAGWSGSVMRAKTLKSTEPLDTFVNVIIDDFLRA
jgi:TetR/AcrR family transcriptional repressor of nem operon